MDCTFRYGIDSREQVESVMPGNKKKNRKETVEPLGKPRQDMACLDDDLPLLCCNSRHNQVPDSKSSHGNMMLFLCLRINPVVRAQL
jgi:hypothetical protein